MSYYDDQINPVIDSLEEHTKASIKIVGWDGTETNWMSISVDALEAIRDILNSEGE